MNMMHLQRTMFIASVFLFRFALSQTLFDVLFPCDKPLCETDPCESCDGGPCETTPTTVRTGLFGWRTCPGCPEFLKCTVAESIAVCCALADQPADCAVKNCTCCSDGTWVLMPVLSNNNSTNTTDACGDFSLEPGEECQYYACTKDLKICPDGSTVGRDYTDPDCAFEPCP